VVARLVLVACALAAALPAPALGQALPGGRALAVTTSLSPDVHLFAEPVRASVRVIVDPRAFDSDRIEIRASFLPYELVRSPERSRRTVGDLVELRYVATLRCLEAACLAPRFQTVLGEQEGGRAERFTFRFAPAQVLYRREGDRVELLLQRLFPPLEVVSRINASQLAAADQLGLDSLPDPSAQSGYAASLAPPEPTYRIPPRALAAGAFVLAGLLLIFPLALASRYAFRRWADGRRPRPLSATERAFLLVEWAVRQPDGEEDRRRALEALADVLEQRGAEPLAATTRTVAWAEEAPDPARTRELGGRARLALGKADGRRS
jgi:hypothetical protein